MSRQPHSHLTVDGGVCSNVEGVNLVQDSGLAEAERVVLEMLCDLSTMASFTTDLFVMFDCSEYYPNVLERLLLALRRRISAARDHRQDWSG